MARRLYIIRIAVRVATGRDDGTASKKDYADVDKFLANAGIRDPKATAPKVMTA